MNRWSLWLGIVGTVGTGLALVVARRWALERPERSWFLGLLGLSPAWLIGFLGQLGAGTGEQGSLPVSAVLSSGAVVVGAIFSDAAVRRAKKAGGRFTPLVYWLLGIAAILPGWLMALLS